MNGTRFAFAILCALAASDSRADISLGTPFSDGVVLQRERWVPVWGQAAAQSRVVVSFAGQSASTVAGTDGRWRVELQPLVASKESRELLVRELDAAGRETARAVVRDVLVGEVWFASGQSNMECPLWSDEPRFRDANGALVQQITHLPHVRLARNAESWSDRPRTDLKAVWRSVTPAMWTEGRVFSAVAFYFARELYLALDLPIGLVESSWGGTNIDAWTPRCGYADCDPSIRDTAEYPVKKLWRSETDKVGPIDIARQQPTVLWNGMVDAWAPMAMRGFIWYQGCHNAREPERYCAKMHALYNGWSRAFENPGLKLYFAQLAPYRDSWLEMCRAQTRFAQEQTNAAIAVTADLGNFDDIHPNRKETVAKRLVVHALKRDYGFAVPEDDSPVFRSARYENGAAILTFDHVKSWYVYSPDRSNVPPFELAGTDDRWRPAKLEHVGKYGRVEGVELVLRADGVDAPCKVRYMARSRTCGTLYNEAALPLGPFRSE